MTYLIYWKNIYKWHNAPPPSITIKKMNTLIMLCTLNTPTYHQSVPQTTSIIVIKSYTLNERNYVMNC
jgi:hypothetical protein